MTPPPLAIDTTVPLRINGSQQRVRLRAARSGLPPLLIVQHGPGFPLLHEVSKFERRLQFEQNHLVAYWEQRGCGNAPADDARSVSLTQQVDDLVAVINWLGDEARQPVLLFGISLGATLSLLAAERVGNGVKAVIANSPDLNTRAGDAAVEAFLHDRVQRAGSVRLQRALIKLGPPPYVDPGRFQRRATLLGSFGSIEHGKTFNATLRETLLAMIGTYGIFGTVRALRNMNTIQRRLLADVAPLDLLTRPPRVTVPVHYVFGEQDALTAAFTVGDLPSVLGGPGTTAIRVPDAGHLVHFDQPATVRSVTDRA